MKIHFSILCVCTHNGQEILASGFSFWQGAYAINYHFAKWFLKCWNVFKRSYSNVLVWFPYNWINVTSLAKFCYTASNLRPIEVFGYYAVGFVDA